MATTRTLNDDIAALLSADHDAVQDPYPLYRRMREESPVHFFDDTTVIVSPHKEAKSVYREYTRFPNPSERGSMFGESKLRLLSEEDKALYAKVIEFESRYMSRMNGETHRRVRSAGQRAFGPKRIAELREVTQRMTNELLDRLAEQATPNFLEFAVRLPLLVIMEMMGAPHEDADMLKEWGDAVNSPQGQMPVRPEAVRAAYEGAVQYRAYVRELAEQHRRDPDKTTLVGALLDASEADHLTEEELVAMYVLLLFAGHETTANMFGNGLFAMLQHRDQWERLCADPTLASGATEEVMRYDSPVQFFVKSTVEEQELAGVRIPPNTYMMIANGSANRDPLEFDDPDDLDISRRPNDQLSLGYGIHFCLGAGVARMEGEIGFGTLARRFPDIELAVDPSEIEYRKVYGLRGLTSLPVKLGRDRGA